MVEPQADPARLSLTLPDEAATARLMADLVLLVGVGDTLALSGDMGAGKTTAARALIRYLADDPDLDVPSPTFTLVQHYDQLPLPVLHADLYRISDVGELDEIGLAPWPDNALVVLEWPERAGRALPANRIEIALTLQPAHGATHREATLTGHGKSKATVARLAALRAFLTQAGMLDAPRQRMAGDASTRSYARLTHEGRSIVLMNAPRRPDGPADYNGKSYSAVVHLAEDVKPFVAMANGLRNAGFSAPAILHADIDAGFLLIEDLGGATIVTGTPPAPMPERYEAAVDMLAALHVQTLQTTLAVAPHVTYTLPSYDLDALLVEASLLLDWYLPDRGRTVDAALRETFATLWRTALEGALAAPPTWVLRDFHSPNIIWLEDRPDTARVGVIDFQDAVLGPAAYDVASLLQDARVDVPETLEIALFARYVKARRAYDADFDAAAFAALYACMAAQRATKILGIFARLNRRDGKPGYLRHQPRVWNYLQRGLSHPSLAALKDWYGANIPPPSPIS